MPYSTDEIRAAGQFAQQIEHVVRHAIGPRANRQADDLRMRRAPASYTVRNRRPARRCWSPAGSTPGNRRTCCTATASGGCPRRSAREYLARGSRRLGLKLRLSQNVQPPTATVPSTFGQVNPASTLTFCTRRPNCLAKMKVTGKVGQTGGPPAKRGSSVSVRLPEVVWLTPIGWLRRVNGI